MGPSCQSLSLGANVLKNEDVLVNVYARTVPQQHLPLVVQVVVSHEHLFMRASQGNHEERESAVGDLAQIASRDYHRTVAALSECARDRMKGVKLAALDALMKIAKSGEPIVIESLRLCLADNSREVRLAAIETLGRVLNWEDTAA